MDFEEQLERAEKSPYPSLVGASVKSADDSSHNNYIHPEKYTGASKAKPAKKSVLNSSVGASLDDLISEGALLGSEEDFDRFLDDKGNVLSDAKYNKAAETGQKQKAELGAAAAHVSSPLRAVDSADDASILSAVEPTPETAGSAPKDVGQHENFSTPNLSEYQIGHQISDHSQLLDSVKSYDLSKLPSADDNEQRSKTNDYYHVSDRAPKGARPAGPKANASFSQNKLEFGGNAHVIDSDSLHTPYFHSEERSSARSRSRSSLRDKSTERSRSRSSAMQVHLARGDNYKNTHEEAPSKYELPAGMKVAEEEEVDDRRSRQSKPTMGDSVAAAEAETQRRESASVTKDPSLVTTGDYTNFDAEGQGNVLDEQNLYSVRSESSTNYLRSISRSRSRKPDPSDHNEKNAASTDELSREGALVSDDPYSQVNGLDNMLQQVLRPSRGPQPSRGQKNLVNDVAAKKKDTETKKQLKEEDEESVKEEEIKEKEIKGEKIKEEEPETKVNDIPAEEKVAESEEQAKAEEAPSVSADDIKVNEKDIGEIKASDVVAPAVEADAESTEDAELTEEVGAEEKIKDASEQLKAEAAPTLTAADIKVEAKSAEEDAPEGSKETEKTEEADETKDSKETEVKEDETDEPQDGELKSETEKTEAETELPESAPVAESSEHEGTENSAESAKEEEQAQAKVEEPELEAKNRDVEPLKEAEAKVESVPDKQEAEAVDDDFDVSPEELRKHLESLPVYLYTSLAGGMQVVTRTNRLATILGANGVKFEYKDLGTDEDAKKLWKRHAQGKLLPGVVRGDDFIGNWQDIEDINEEYRLEEVLYETL